MRLSFNPVTPRFGLGTIVRGESTEAAMLERQREEYLKSLEPVKAALLKLGCPGLEAAYQDKPLCYTLAFFHEDPPYHRDKRAEIVPKLTRWELDCLSEHFLKKQEQDDQEERRLESIAIAQKHSVPRIENLPVCLLEQRHGGYPI